MEKTKSLNELIKIRSLYGESGNPYVFYQKELGYDVFEPDLDKHKNLVKSIKKELDFCAFVFLKESPHLPMEFLEKIQKKEDQAVNYLSFDKTVMICFGGDKVVKILPIEIKKPKEMFGSPTSVYCTSEGISCDYNYNQKHYLVDQYLPSVAPKFYVCYGTDDINAQYTKALRKREELRDHMGSLRVNGNHKEADILNKEFNQMDSYLKLLERVISPTVTHNLDVFVSYKITDNDKKDFTFLGKEGMIFVFGDERIEIDTPKQLIEEFDSFINNKIMNHSKRQHQVAVVGDIAINDYNRWVRVKIDKEELIFTGKSLINRKSFQVIEKLATIANLPTIQLAFDIESSFLKKGENISAVDWFDDYEIKSSWQKDSLFSRDLRAWVIKTFSIKEFSKYVEIFYILRDIKFFKLENNLLKEEILKNVWKTFETRMFENIKLEVRSSSVFNLFYHIFENYFDISKSNYYGRKEWDKLEEQYIEKEKVFKYCTSVCSLMQEVQKLGVPMSVSRRILRRFHHGKFVLTFVLGLIQKGLRPEDIANMVFRFPEQDSKTKQAMVLNISALISVLGADYQPKIKANFLDYLNHKSIKWLKDNFSPSFGGTETVTEA